MHRRRLDDRARRRDEPVEARGRVELRDRARLSGSPAAMRSIALEVRPHRRRGRGPARAPRARRSSSSVRAARIVERPAEDDDADVDPLAALDARHEAVDRVGERATRLTRSLRFRDERPRRLEPRRRRYSTYEPRSSPSSHSSGTAAATSSSNSLGDLRREPLVRLGDRAGEREAGRARRSPRTGAARARAPARRVVEVERRAVVDQPEPAVPEEQVRVLRGAVDVRHERVEPDDRGRELGRGRRPGRRAERQRAREEVDAEVEARARASRSWISGSGSARAERGVELDERELGTRKPSARASSPATTSATSAFGPWPAPRNLST